MLFWNPRNLRKHYQKHPLGNCRNCWASALSTPPPITLSQYEYVSRTAEWNAWLSFEAKYREDSTSREKKCKYFLTEKLILSVVELPHYEIQTSYRVHRNQNTHDIGTTLEDYKAFIIKLGRKKDNEFEVKIYKIRQVVTTQKNLTNLTVKEYNLLSATAISRLGNY